jgi:hypothetical protein
MLIEPNLGLVIVDKPVIDARTDPTKPATASIDMATGEVTSLLPSDPLPLWEDMLLWGAGGLALGFLAGMISRLPPPDYSVSYSTRRPVVIYEDDPEPVVIRRRRTPLFPEPTVVVEEPPTLLVNPGGRRKKAKR